MVVCPSYACDADYQNWQFHTSTPRTFHISTGATTWSTWLFCSCWLLPWWRRRLPSPTTVSRTSTWRKGHATLQWHWLILYLQCIQWLHEIPPPDLLSNFALRIQTTSSVPIRLTFKAKLGSCLFCQRNIKSAKRKGKGLGWKKFCTVTL